MIHLASVLQYLMPWMGGQHFFFWRFIAIFLLKENPGYQYKKGFSFKITKN
jgi:hypothetical protein